MIEPRASASDIGDVAPALIDAEVLVTGGSGFLGRRLVERLALECGAKPRVLVRTHSRIEPLTRIGADRVVLVKGDLGDARSLSEAVQGCRVVFHCAMDRSDRQSNIDGINSLVAACTLHNARLVHVSTIAVYEPLQDGDLDESMPPIHSGLPYSEMKLEVEERVMEAVRMQSLDACIVLPAMVYGPHAKAWTVSPAEQLASGTVVLPDQGEGLCNAVYVDDVCQAMLRAAVVPAARGRRYLISGATPPTWGAFFQGIADALGRPGPRYASAEEIRRGASLRGLKLVLRDPKRLMRVGPLRKLTGWTATRIGPRGRARLERLYGLYQRRLPPPVYVPNAQQLALYRARCRVRIDRAMTELGYRPAYDLARGMQVTAEWLRQTQGAAMSPRARALS
jgi:nucleoside-diphosphate-sugar epimerase